MSAQTRQIVVTGSESTGKSTIVAHLSRRFGVSAIPESARTFAGFTGRALGPRDVDAIARLHQSMVRFGCRASPPVLLLDTDLVTTTAYARVLYGRVPDWIVEAMMRSRADAYLVCTNDLGWQEEARQRTSLEVQSSVQTEIVRILTEMDADVYPITGSGTSRSEAATAAFERVLEGLGL